MSSFAILTNIGRNKEAAALATGNPLIITDFAWGDGDRIPAGGETTLLNEQGRKPVQAQGLVDGAANTAFFDALLDETEGPFVIREAGLFDDDGDLIAIAKYDPSVNKPLNTVSAVLRINIVFSDLENLVLQVNSTNAFVPAERQVIAGVGLKDGGALGQNVTINADIPTEVEAVAGVRNDALMTPMRVLQSINANAPNLAYIAAEIDAAINGLIDGAPDALNTLNEIAAALADDANHVATMIAQLAGKLGSTATAVNSDKLDGLHASSFYRSDMVSVIDSPDTRMKVKSRGAIAQGTAGESGLEINNGDGDLDAFMSFYIAGDYATYFGLSGAKNDLVVGGWSKGLSEFRLWHEGNDGTGSGLDADKVDGLEASVFVRNDQANAAAIWMNRVITTNVTGGDQNQSTDFENGIYVEPAEVWTDKHADISYCAALVAKANDNRGFVIAVEATDMFARKIHGTMGPWMKIWTDQNDDALVKTSPDYTNYVANWTVNTPITFYHGLGVIPTRVSMVWVCKVANNGWAVGDELEISWGHNSSLGVHKGMSATTITAGVRASYAQVKGTTVVFSIIDDANWGIKIRASK